MRTPKSPTASRLRAAVAKACGPFASGSPISMRASSAPRRTANRSRLPPAPMRGMIRISSTPAPILNETRGDLDRRRGQGLCR